VGGCGGGAGGGGGGSRARPAAGVGPLPRAGAQVDVDVSTGGLPLLGVRGCLCEWSGGRPHAVAASCGRPPVHVRRRLCAGFRKCGSFVEVFIVD
jgi:hypothetical protein